jgi:hypothetical protein
MSIVVKKSVDASCYLGAFDTATYAPPVAHPYIVNALPFYPLSPLASFVVCIVVDF